MATMFWLVLVLLAFLAGLVLGAVLALSAPRGQGRLKMLLVLTDEQKATLAVQPLTGAGNPAKVDGVPVWQSSDDTVATVVVDEANPFTATVLSAGLGNAQVSASMDADLGEGTRPVVAVLDVQVAPAEAVSASITAGAPEPK